MTYSKEKKRLRDAAYRGRNRTKLQQREAARIRVANRNGTFDGRITVFLKEASSRAAKKQLPYALTRKYLEPLLQMALDAGTVTCACSKPDTASVDQVVLGLGYVEGNVQVVPSWFNYAKNEHSHEDVTAAIMRWVAANARA